MQSISGATNKLRRGTTQVSSSEPQESVMSFQSYSVVHATAQNSNNEEEYTDKRDWIPKSMVTIVPYEYEYVDADGATVRVIDQIEYIDGAMVQIVPHDEGSDEKDYK
ncbi:MAG: hypothetical protein SGARI_006549 [Bacillariaceae sp.]